MTRQRIEGWYRLPEDWTPTPELLDWAQKKRPDLYHSEVLDEVENFTEFWHNKQGKEAEKKDWDRAFQTWIRKCNVRFRRPGHQPPSHGGLVV